MKREFLSPTGKISIERFEINLNNLDSDISDIDKLISEIVTELAITSIVEKNIEGQLQKQELKQHEKNNIYLNLTNIHSVRNNLHKCRIDLLNLKFKYRKESNDVELSLLKFSQIELEKLKNLNRMSNMNELVSIDVLQNIEKKSELLNDIGDEYKS